jgi:hypothetical protein
MTSSRLRVLDRNQEETARRFENGHHIITGPSGCGKTVILVHKAAFLIDNSYWTDDQIDRLVYIAAARARDQLWIPYTRETALISRMLACMKR